MRLSVFHICEPEIKELVDESVYDEQVGMMEMVLDVDDIISEMSAIKKNFVNICSKVWGHASPLGKSSGVRGMSPIWNGTHLLFRVRLSGKKNVPKISCINCEANFE